MIDRLCDEAREEDVAVSGFYCDFRNQEELTAANIIGAILKQLVAREDMLEHVRTAFKKAKKELGGRGLRLQDMMQVAKQAVATLPQVFICIDALDECLPKNLLELLKSLRDILQESPRMRIFVTGRPHVEVEIIRYFAAIIVPISPGMHEIKRYLEKKLEMDTMCDAMSDDLRADILRIIPERISEMCVGVSTAPTLYMVLCWLIMVCSFLLVSLNIDAILGEVTIFDRRQKLNEMTKGNHLEDAYATTLARMKAQKGSRSRLGMEALMWVSNSERPLHTSELCHALGVKIGSPDLSVESIPTIRTLLACSLGLITVEASSSTARLVHFSLQEYLSNNAGLFQSPHTMITEVCLTYLNFHCARELSPTLTSAPPTVPLVRYASCYWGKHIGREKAGSVSPFALELLIQFERHISSQLLLLRYDEDRNWGEPSFDGRSGPKGFTGLHGAAFFGIVEIVVALLAMKEWDINVMDNMGRTALAWAAVRGHEAVVKILLQLEGAKADTADNQYGRTPLLDAARNGHGGVVKLLLEREDINPNTADTEYSQTPLSWAVENGHERVVKLLLEREDINHNTADIKHGLTPLLLAAKSGRAGIVKLLLEREDINPNTADIQYSRTPLMWAAQYGHEGVVKLLLEREDINPNTADIKHGLTPLLLAAKSGRARIVKLLLEREDINPNTADTEYGRMPLSWAAENGHERVVKLLLEREGINPNTEDTKHGRTPLWWAARNGHEGVVKLLLEREDIDPNTADIFYGRYGRTPLLWAAKSGCAGIVKLLLEREDINPNTADIQYSGTPLLWAAQNGHERVVKLLLEREDIDPNATYPFYSRTPLLWATENRHEGVVKLLLEREDIDPNTVDAEYGRTPISWAAENGHLGIVKLLLEREDINPNTTDTRYSETPLLWAAKSGHSEVVKLLLEREDISPNTADTKYGQTPLLWAAKSGHSGVVKLLLEREDINPNTADTKFGETPLSWAAENGHLGVVKLLLGRGGIDPNTVGTKYGRTPLLWAAMNGHEGAVKLLLGRDDINLDIRDLEGKTALELAAYGGHTKVVELLSAPKPSLPLRVDIDEVPEHPPSPDPSDLLQSPTQSIPAACPPPANPIPPDTRPVLRMAIGSFTVVSALIFLFYFLAVISPSFLTILLLSFRG